MFKEILRRELSGGGRAEEWRVQGDSGMWLMDVRPTGALGETGLLQGLVSDAEYLAHFAPVLRLCVYCHACRWCVCGGTMVGP